MVREEIQGTRGGNDFAENSAGGGDQTDGSRRFQRIIRQEIPCFPVFVLADIQDDSKKRSHLKGYAGSSQGSEHGSDPPDPIKNSCIIGLGHKNYKDNEGGYTDKLGRKLATRYYQIFPGLDCF